MHWSGDRHSDTIHECLELCRRQSGGPESFEQLFAQRPRVGLGIALRFSHCLMPIAIITASGMRVVKARRISGVGFTIVEAFT